MPLLLLWINMQLPKTYLYLSINQKQKTNNNTTSEFSPNMVAQSFEK